MFLSLVAQEICLFAGPLDTQQRDKRRLAGCLVLTGLFADGFLIAFDIKKIIRNLKGQADIMCIGMEVIKRVLGGLAKDSSGLTRHSDQLASLHTLQASDFRHL